MKVTYRSTASADDVQWFGQHIMWGAGRAAAKFLSPILIVLFVLAALSAIFDWPERDSTDSPTERSNMALRTDYGTGCQYLESRDGFLTPRLDATGKQVCNPSSSGES